jgi:hypothetical protein
MVKTLHAPVCIFDILCKQDRDVEQDREDAISYASRNRSRSRASRYFKGQSPEKYLKGKNIARISTPEYFVLRY